LLLFHYMFRLHAAIFRWWGWIEKKPPEDGGMVPKHVVVEEHDL
jgi:hypothetical protein